VIRRWLQTFYRHLVAPRMLYGWQRGDGIWLPHTRVCSSTRVECPELLDVADHVYIGPFNLIDASAGLSIGEGAQITSHCAVLTHSSHQAVRLAGRRYWGAIGRGAIVRAYSYVDGEVPDFAIVAGQPAAVVGDTRQADAAYLAAHPEHRADYDAWAQPR
jgi:UDP-3-O-[3-hydroxymyristoyl] glucosamine N-acyltransferase